jgi:hypothetical protein
VATTAVTPTISAERPAVPFERVAAGAALAAGALGFLYAVAFLVLRSPALSALCLMLGALLSTAVFVALHARLAPAGGLLATWGLVLAAAGALGAVAHGGFDLAHALHPVGSADPDAVSHVDPRGVFTFGVSGLGLACLALAMLRSALLPRALAALGLVSAALSLTLYVGRLVIVDASSPAIALPALVEGFVVSPMWYAWLGTVLWRTVPARVR